jgi:hypothetical protein
MMFVKRILLGVVTMAMAAMLAVLFNGSAVITRDDVLITFAIGIFIGLATYVVTWQRISMLTGIVLHAILVGGAIFAVDIWRGLFTQAETGRFIIEFIILYILGFLFTRSMLQYEVTEINKLIKQNTKRNL